MMTSLPFHEMTLHSDRKNTPRLTTSTTKSKDDVSTMFIKPSLLQTGERHLPPP
jgi:hypothetical protein